jgi:hypothetical protein
MGLIRLVETRTVHILIRRDDAFEVQVDSESGVAESVNASPSSLDAHADSPKA